MINIDKNELAGIGVQFGNLARRWNPRMRPYIFKKINRIHILDLDKIFTSCQKVDDYIKSLIEKKKTILFLSTKNQAQKVVKEAAKRCGMPYIINKWKGGVLTNFREIGKKLKELEGLSIFSNKDSFRNLIKKDQVSKLKKKNKLLNIYEGIVGLKTPPNALFIIGLHKEKTAFKEAKKMGIPVIAVCNSNCNPQLVDYVIPGNDENIKSITFFANLLADSIIRAREKISEEKELETEEKNEEVNFN